MAAKTPVPMLCLHPKKGKEEAFLALLDVHWPALRAAGLASARRPRRGRGASARLRALELRMAWLGHKNEGAIRSKEPDMKLVARCLAALAVLAFATPALPCGDKTMKTTTASADKEKEKEKSSTVAKSSTAKKGSQAKQAGEAKPATAAN